MKVKDTFKYKSLELIGLIGHNLIERANHSDIKNFFKTDIDVNLNRQYNNYDMRENEFLVSRRWNEYTLIPNVPLFRERTEYVSDFKYPSSVIANINDTKAKLINIKFNLDEANVIDFHIFKINLTYTNQNDRSIDWFSFFAINSMKINNNSILFSDFCECLDIYHSKFIEVLERLITDIKQSKINEREYNEITELEKINKRKTQILSYINYVI